MVDLTKVEAKINEFEDFFRELVSNPDNLNTTSTVAGIQYGLECALGMKRAISSYRKKPSNKHLKSIFYGFTAISRGVESFVDYDLEMRFRKCREGVYQIKENLEQHIKW